MSYTGTNMAIDGSAGLSRMTLTPLENGRARRLIEQSKDNRQNWYIWFEDKYLPKK